MMPLSEIDWELLSIDYAELHRPPINLPRNLTDEFNRILLSGDAEAIGSYYRDVILQYCYSAGLDKEEFEQWAKEKSAEGGKKSGRGRRFTAQENYFEWQREADARWSINPYLSKSQVANSIANRLREKSEIYSYIKPFSADTIRRQIKKK